MKANSGKIDFLQVLRAFAAAFVMFFHGTQIIEEELGYLFLNNIFCAGFCGVDIFFVLSGFVIFYTSAGKNLSTRYFLEKRFARIFPVYWVVTALLIALYFISPSPNQAYKGNLGFILTSLILFPQNGYVLGVAWTLSYEIIFYIVFSISFLKKPVYLVWIFACWIAAIFFVQISGHYPGNYTANMLLKPIIINFAMGCVLAWLYRKYPRFSYYWVFVIVGMILFLVSWFDYYQRYSTGIEQSFFQIDHREIAFGVPAAIFMFGILYVHIPVSKLLVFLGDASYSLYLLHGTIIKGFTIGISKLGLKNYFDGFIGTLIIFASTLAIASCFYLVIEKPLLKMVNKLLLKQTVKRTENKVMIVP